MSSNVFAGLICSVGMFLFGIDAMGEAMKKLSGEKMKGFISAVTKSRLTAALSGCLATGILQSSCAVSVMTTQLVDAGAMTVIQAVGVIMGANIGTTVTSLLIAVNFSAFAPPAVFAGVMLKMFSKNEKVQSAGLAAAGFGLLFAAMSLMSEYMSFFAEERASAALTASGGRIKSLLFGLILTAVMQSSSATVGMLQAAAAGGMISTKNALYVLFGQNIGAVLPTLLANVKSDPPAKKTALIHLLFNVFGTAIFICLTELLPYSEMLEKIENGYFRVSLAHVLFNLISTAVLLPFSGRLIKLTDRIVKE